MKIIIYISKCILFLSLFQWTEKAIFLKLIQVRAYMRFYCNWPKKKHLKRESLSRKVLISFIINICVVTSSIIWMVAVGCSRKDLFHLNHQNSFPLKYRQDSNYLNSTAHTHAHWKISATISGTKPGRIYRIPASCISESHRMWLMGACSFMDSVLLWLDFASGFSGWTLDAGFRRRGFNCMLDYRGKQFEISKL